MKYLSCLKDPSGTRKDGNSPLLAHNDEIDVNGKKRGCLFCDVSRETGFNVVWENEELIAFRDRYVCVTKGF